MIGIPELILILIIILILFGARRLPELGEGLGRGIRSFQRSLTEGKGPKDPTEPEEGDEPPGPIDPR